MKRIVFTTILCCCCIAGVFSQAIPNPGLETWTHSTFPAYDNPNGWGTLNSSTAIININTVQKSTDKHGGTYAARLETFYISFASRIAPGIMVTGTFNTTTEAVEGGIIYTQRPTLLSGWYKYAPAASDTCVITVELWRWNAGVRESVAEGTFTKTTAVSSYTQFNAMLNYTSSALPDSARIIVSSSSTSRPVAGSVLFVDDFSFVTLSPFTITEDSANAICSGACNGRAAVIPVGGQTPYTYLWSTSAGSTTDSSKTGLCAGAYSVTVTDGIGQTLTANFNITNATSLTAPTMSATNNCGIANGTATATPTSGVLPYAYQWDPNAFHQSTQTAAGLPAGTYNVTVTDGNGCSVSSSSTVGTTQLSAPNTTSTNENCGLADGTATAVPAAGLAPYGYQWDAAAANQTTALATGLTAGAYNVTVTDDNGCTATATASVSSSGGLSATTISEPALCNSGNNGVAIVIPAGGTSPYTYVWSPNAGGQVTDTARNLSPGLYNVTVSDAGSCTYVTSATINEPSAIAIIINHDVILCYGDSGDVIATVGGGTSPYTYLWDGGETTDRILNQPAGNYCVTVTDDNGCQRSACDTVVQPAQLTATMTHTTILCFGETSDVTVSATGGTGPYEYSWDSGETTTTITGQLAGTNYATVTDDNGCMAAASNSITGPGALFLTLTSTNVTTPGGSDGTATVTAGGGTMPVNYAWSNSQPGGNLTGLTAGTYIVTATDANGCELVDSVVITEPVGISNVSTMGFSVYPNPVKDELTVNLGNSNVNLATVNVYNSLGALVHTQTGAGKMVLSTTSLASGIFMLEVQAGGERMTKKLVKLAE